MEVDTTVKEQLIGENKRSNKSAIIKELILYGVIFVLCVFIIPRYVVQKTIVDGESMELSLYDQDRLLIDKLTYQFQDVKVCIYQTKERWNGCEQSQV